MNQLKEAILMASFFCIFPKYFNKTLILHIYSLFFLHFTNLSSKAKCRGKQIYNTLSAY